METDLAMVLVEMDGKLNLPSLNRSIKQEG